MLSIILAAAAALQPAVPQGSVHDRMDEICAVSGVDLAGQRLARECRAQVRAQYEAERQALAAREARKLPVRTAAR